ncbi:hypothetical protein ES703_18824 [subsurface metagenome]
MNELERLREFKRNSEWSYRKLASMMENIHLQSIYNWLTNKHVPSQLAIEKIGRFLEVYENPEKKGLRNEDL